MLKEPLPAAEEDRGREMEGESVEVGGWWREGMAMLPRRERRPRESPLLGRICGGGGEINNEQSGPRSSAWFYHKFFWKFNCLIATLRLLPSHESNKMLGKLLKDE